MSVTVGFSQATTPLLAAAGTTRPDGTPADGGPEGDIDANLFATLLGLLAPGTQAAEPADPAATDTAAVAAPAPATLLPPDLPTAAPADETVIPPELAELTTSTDGKALLGDFADALKAARQALDNGEPLDPALEKKLEEAVNAIAAWFAGQPLLQPTPAPVEPGQLDALAGSGAILPPAPPEADPAGIPDIVLPAPVPAAVEAKIVPAALAKLGESLKDFAAELRQASPKLADALAQLGDRMATGDIADDVLAQLGLTRTPDGTTPELDQIVAALTPTPQPKPATAPQPPIAAPVLDPAELLAAEPAAAASRASGREQPDSDTAPRVELDADLRLEPKARPEDKPSSNHDKPAGPVHAAAQPTDTPAQPAAPAAASDATAPVAQVAASAATTATRAIHAAYAAPVQQLNLPQVAFEVARQFEAGNTRFQIRLDPPELGRIDVKLDLDKHGTVNARMFVERPETLDLMLRDQRALQQALQQAGLDTGKANLEFSLRQNPFAGADAGQGGGNGGQPGFGPVGTPVADEAAEPAVQTLYRGSASQSGVNLFV